jgi:hypothetical protein
MDIAEVLRIRTEKLEDGTLKPNEYNWIKKSRENPHSKSMAIKAMCFHCVGGTADSMPDSGWKKSISECTAPQCPLYAFRWNPSNSTELDSTIEEDPVG